MVETGVAVNLFSQMGTIEIYIGIHLNPFKQQVKLFRVFILCQVDDFPVPANASGVITSRLAGRIFGMNLLLNHPVVGQCKISPARIVKLWFGCA